MAAAPRYACNNITMVHSTVVTNTDNNWKGDDSDGTVSGYISFRQDTQYDRAVVCLFRFVMLTFSFFLTHSLVVGKICGAFGVGLGLFFCFVFLL